VTDSQRGAVDAAYAASTQDPAPVIEIAKIAKEIEDIRADLADLEGQRYNLEDQLDDLERRLDELEKHSGPVSQPALV